ncbi:MAG: hypothetical protein IKX80_03650, partial [Lachnospiraceae bacterium]|nr:hypothetical protein [Lachnospiraceae bacterium]
MKNMIKRIAALTLALILLTVPAAVLADTGYTYNYDYWEETQYSPDAYAVRTTITYKELGLDKKFEDATSIFVRGNLL